MSGIKVSAVIVSTLLGGIATASSYAQGKAAAPATQAPCKVTVHATEEAEKKMGGAQYEGPMGGAEAMPGMTGEMPGMTTEMPGTAGTHEVHIGQQGGVFFMAPDKIHHVEAKYSKECGMQLFVYNAFTEPIGTGRFQALYRIIPEDDNEWDKEVVRFLSPAAGGAILQARGDQDIKGPFKIELYVKFPESDDAEMFNIPVEQAAQ